MKKKLLLLMLVLAFGVSDTVGQLFKTPLLGIKKEQVATRSFATEKQSDAPQESQAIMRASLQEGFGTYYQLPAKSTVIVNGNYSNDTLLRYRKYDAKGRAIERYDKSFSLGNVISMEKHLYHTLSTGVDVLSFEEGLSFRDARPDWGYSEETTYNHRDIPVLQVSKYIQEGVFRYVDVYEIIVNGDGYPTSMVNEEGIDEKYDAKGRLVSYSHPTSGDLVFIEWDDNNLPKTIYIAGEEMLGSKTEAMYISNFSFKKPPVNLPTYLIDGLFSHLLNRNLTVESAIFDASVEVKDRITGNVLRSAEIISTANTATRTYTMNFPAITNEENSATSHLIIDEDGLGYKCVWDNNSFRRVKYQKGLLVENTYGEEDAQGNVIAYESGVKYNYSTNGTQLVSCQKKEYSWSGRDFSLVETEIFEYTPYVEPGDISTSQRKLKVLSQGGGVAYVGGRIPEGKESEYDFYTGATLRLTLKPDLNYQLLSIMVDGVEKIDEVFDDQLTFTSSENVNVVARFEERLGAKHLVTFGIEGNGTVSVNGIAVKNAQQLSVVEGETVRMDINSVYGESYLSRMQVGDSLYDASGQLFQFVVKEPTVVAVTFVPDRKVLTSVKVGSGGKVRFRGNEMSSQSSFETLFTDSHFFEIRPDSGMVVSAVLLNGEDITNRVAYGYLELRRAFTETNNVLEFSFAPIKQLTFVVSIHSPGSMGQDEFFCNGMALFNGTSITISDNNSSELSFYLATYFQDAVITKFLVNGNDYLHLIQDRMAYVQNITSGGTIEIEVKSSIRSLSVDYVGGGTVQYDNNVILSGSTIEVGLHSSMAFTLYPEAGFKVSQVLLNGTDVTSQLIGNIYTISPIEKDSEFSVVFESISSAEKFAASNLQVYVANQQIIVDQVEPGTSMAVYTLRGALVMQRDAVESREYLLVDANQQEYIVRVGNRSFKVTL